MTTTTSPSSERSFAVAQHDVADVPHARPSIMTEPAGTGATLRAAPLLNSTTSPDVAHDRIGLGDAQLLGNHRVVHQMAVFAVDGDEVLGFGQRENELELLLAGVARRHARRPSPNR